MVLPASLLHEPAWDIVLSIYTSAASAYVVDLMALTEVTGMSLATSSRLLNVLEEHGVVERMPGKAAPTYSLTKTTETALERYLSGLPAYVLLAQKDQGSVGGTGESHTG